MDLFNKPPSASLEKVLLHSSIVRNQIDDDAQQAQFTANDRDGKDERMHVQDQSQARDRVHWSPASDEHDEHEDHVPQHMQISPADSRR